MIIRLLFVLSALIPAAALAEAAPDVNLAAPASPESPPAPTGIAPAASDSVAVAADAEARRLLRDLPPEVLDKLSAVELVEVLKQREVTKRQQLNTGEPPAVAIVVPLAFFLMSLGIVALILRFRSRRDEKLHATMQKMIEKGVEIPPALIFPPVSKDGDLRKGLILSGLGLATANALFVLGPPGSWSLGLIPLFAGLGYLAVFRFAQRRTES